MKKEFEPGVIVQAKVGGALKGIFRKGEPEQAEILRYDLEGFYIVKTSRSSSFVVHEDDIELAHSTRKMSASSTSGVAVATSVPLEKGGGR